MTLDARVLSNNPTMGMIPPERMKTVSGRTPSGSAAARMKLLSGYQRGCGRVINFSSAVTPGARGADRLFPCRGFVGPLIGYKACTNLATARAGRRSLLLPVNPRMPLRA
jgi:hypothetical protein